MTCGYFSVRGKFPLEVVGLLTLALEDREAKVKRKNVNKRARRNRK